MRFVLAFLSVAALNVPSVAGATPAAKTMSFRGSYKGTASYLKTFGSVNGEGAATMLGSSLLRSNDQRVPSSPTCNVVTGMGAVTASGRGDLEYTYRFSMCGTQAQTDRGTYKIIRGTGRMTGAHGHGRYVEIFRQGVPGPVTIRFRGKLKLP